MIITRVTLDNIKSYRHATITLGNGTTAIRGINGAGKSTIVEAIGYALFDFLPYARQQFVREGEKSGKVVVRFISSRDECEYEVERRCTLTGTGAWFVVSCESGSPGGRLAEGKDDMVAFLRDHLGIEGTIPLGDLFDNAIAVQQGTFTADFLLTPQIRKKKFDTLLQIEDYRKAAEHLRETERFLRETMSVQERTIERLTTQIADLNTWQISLDERQREIVALSAQISVATTERIDIDARRQKLSKERDHIQQLNQERERCYGILQTERARSTAASATAERASFAASLCERTRDAYEAYRAAQIALQQAQVDSDKANKLHVQITRYATSLQSDEEIRQLSIQRLADAEAAARESQQLIASVTRQQQLEEQRTNALRAHQSLSEIDRELSQLTGDIERAEQEIEQTTQEIAQLDSLEPLAQLLRERRQTVQRLRAEAAMLDERRQQQAKQMRSLSMREQSLSKTEQEIAHYEAQLAEARAYLPDVSSLPTLETDLQHIDATIALLQAEVQQYEAQIHSSQGGLCPILKEPCHNMTSRGMNGLDEYYADLVIQKSDERHRQQRQREQLGDRVTILRDSKTRTDRIPLLEQSLTDAKERRVAIHDEIDHLQKELQQLTDGLASAEDLAQAIKEAEQVAGESELADRKRTMLPKLRSGMTSACERRDTAQTRFHERQQEQIVQHQLAAQLQPIQAELDALGDPRTRYTQLRVLADRADTLRAEIVTIDQRMEATKGNFAGIQQQLAALGDVDGRVQAQRSIIENAHADHDTYLQHSAEAEREPEATRQANDAIAAVAHAEKAYEAANAAYTEASANCDLTELDALERRLSDIQQSIARDNERLQQAHIQLKLLQAQITEAESRRIELAAIQQEYDSASGTLDFLGTCRDILRDAGPDITKAMLAYISSQADTIFTTIMGDHAGRLSWEEGYEITLRTGSNLRTFAQLSGGEQMSAALAIRLALLRTLTRSHMVIFDEPTQNMDDERRANLAGQIRRISDFEQLLVISHDDTFEEGLDAVIWVHKADSESHVRDNGRILPAFMPPMLIQREAEE
jgi:DNA repair protein SbcC/Rad50